MRHPDPVRVLIALPFLLIAAAIVADATVGVPPLLALTSPATALLLGVRALLDSQEGGR